MYATTINNPIRAVQHAGTTIQGRVLAFWICLFLVARIIPGASEIILYATAAYVLIGTRQTVQGLSILAILILMGGTGGAAARWIVVFAAFGRMAIDTVLSQASVPKIVWPISLYTLCILFFTPLSSSFPTISALKVISFWTGTVALLTAFHRTRHLHAYWLSWFMTIGVFMTFMSVFVYLVGGGYGTTSAGFEGMLSHPQTFGPVMGSMAALLTGLAIFRGKQRWFLMVAICVTWWGMYASGSRTSLLATILAFLIAVSVGGLKLFTWWPRVQRVLLHPVALLVYVAVLGYMVIQFDAVQERVLGFLVKDTYSSMTAVESLTASRAELIATSYENFKSSPIMGIGFGVPSDADIGYIARGFMGLPTGASVEKGFMPTAVLEETGIVGAFLVLMLIVMLVRPVWISGQPLLIWVMMACLLVNFGEMVFFSMGGMGFYFWLLMAFLHTSCTDPPAFIGVDDGN